MGDVKGVKELAHDVVDRCWRIATQTQWKHHIREAITQATAAKDAEMERLTKDLDDMRAELVEAGQHVERAATERDHAKGEVERLKERAMHAELLAEQLGRELEDQILPRHAAPSSEAIERVARKIVHGRNADVSDAINHELVRLVTADIETLFACPPSSEAPSEEIDHLKSVITNLLQSLERVIAELPPGSRWGLPVGSINAAIYDARQVVGSTNATPPIDTGSAESPVVGVKYEGPPERDADEVAIYIDDGQRFIAKVRGGKYSFHRSESLCSPWYAEHTIAHQYLTQPAESEGLVWEECEDDDGNTIYSAEVGEANCYSVVPHVSQNEVAWAAVHETSEGGKGFDSLDTPDAAKAACQEHYKQSKAATA